MSVISLCKLSSPFINRNERNELTCPNNLLDFDKRDINLFGKLPHRLIRVFVSKRVDVDFHSLKRKWKSK